MIFLKIKHFSLLSNTVGISNKGPKTTPHSTVDQAPLLQPGKNDATLSRIFLMPTYDYLFVIQKYKAEQWLAYIPSGCRWSFSTSMLFSKVQNTDHDTSR